ncbi:hypothetical protein EMPG_12649, partial [Blastomyces silverae]
GMTSCPYRIVIQRLVLPKSEAPHASTFRMTPPSTPCLQPSTSTSPSAGCQLCLNRNTAEQNIYIYHYRLQKLRLPSPSLRRALPSPRRSAKSLLHAVSLPSSSRSYSAYAATAICISVHLHVHHSI